MELTGQLKQLVDAAWEAQKQAYAPFSRFRVGAALLGEDGKIYMGCNVENSSYSLTICAERVAVFKAVSEGVRSFRLLVLVSDAPDPVTPCGACRQVLYEFTPDLEILSVGRSGKTLRLRLSDLLPHGFKL